MFAEVRAVIERYAARTHTVIILGKTLMQGKYGGPNEKHTTKRTGCPFVVGVNYHKKTQKFVITKTCLEHNHDIFPDATRFSTVMRKLDQDNLGLIEKLHNDGLRTRDIFSVLNSISSKYTHKPDVYNAVSRQQQRKLQGLDEIEILFKTLRNDENIIGNVATKAIHNDERDQDGAFIQAVFWAYSSAFLDFSVAMDVLVIDATYKTNRFSMPLIVICSIDQFGSTYSLAFALVYSETYEFYQWVMQQLSQALTKLIGDAKKNVEIEEFIQAIQRLVYGDISVDQIDQELAELWKRFPNTKIYMLETWILHKESWLGPYTNGNINLDIKSSQRVESLHSKLKGVENRIMPVDKMLSILWRQIKEHSQKLAYETFLHQNRYTYNNMDVGLEELRLICSRYAFESFIKQQAELANSVTYEVLEQGEDKYNVTHVDNQKTYIVNIGAPSTCTCLHPQRTRTPCQHIIMIYLQHLHIRVPSIEIHELWHVRHSAETENITGQVSPLVKQIFSQLPKCHHNGFLDLMKCTSEYVLENGKVPELSRNESVIKERVFKTISIDNTINNSCIKMPELKRTRGRPPNNRRILGAEEKENKLSLKKQKVDKNNVMLHLPDVNLNSRIPQSAIFQVHDPLGDGNCGFRSLAMAIFKEEENWQDVKNIMRSYLVERADFYSKVLGYDINRLTAVLTCMISGCSQEYWFYAQNVHS
ncbi:16290_t:CDS:2 [Gigaspora margarita]|uniref:16290_t:CDS:1 n=1 Tax=Gigaspora margarita TaxID=4874 RepID=A0ABM8VW00_GIGMA|nr:16290_t:CDS:2 [Gigaspora margarita]